MPVEDDRRRRLIKTALVVITFGIVLWYFAIEPQMLKVQSYSGVVVDKYSRKRWRDWWRDNPSVKWCYLIVRTDTGREKRVEVPCTSFWQYREGDRIEKRRGERYPRVVESESGRPRAVPLYKLDEILKHPERSGSADRGEGDR